MDGWVIGWVLRTNHKCCYTISLELDTDELMIKVMRKDKGCKTKESDSNKLFIDNVSGD
jgi:hypothetical protein